MKSINTRTENKNDISTHVVTQKIEAPCNIKEVRNGDEGAADWCFGTAVGSR